MALKRVVLTKVRAIGLSLFVVLALVATVSNAKRLDWWWFNMLGTKAPVFAIETKADSPSLNVLLIRQTTIDPRSSIHATKKERLKLEGKLSIDLKKWRFSKDRIRQGKQQLPRAQLIINILRYTSLQPGYISVQSTRATIERVTSGNNWKAVIHTPPIEGEYVIFGQLKSIESMEDPSEWKFRDSDEFIFCRHLVVSDE
jgi:hypothetical protein